MKGTDWGSLDLLLLDLPPGTGDVQMTICQELELSGAVAVTTPSKLAVTDAKKGIDMFESMGVPTLVAVENMSYFVVSELWICFYFKTFLFLLYNFKVWWNHQQILDAWTI